MLTSLFGAIAPRRLDDRPADSGLALATPVVDVVVDASPALAMRAHFAASRGDLDQASARITLLDPSRLWATQVIHALCEAANQPLERLALRERATLRTLAVIERATVPRRGADALKVYHADIRTNGLEQQEIATALAERSHLTAVIVGAMQPPAVNALLRALLDATRQAEWHCPALVFMLPPGALALRRHVLEQDWPPHVHASAMTEALSGAHSVWNNVLTAWEASTSLARAASAKPGAGTEATPPTPATAAAPDGQAMARALASLARGEGVLACGVVDLASSELVAADPRLGSAARLAPSVHALCAALRACTQASNTLLPPPDELLVTTGGEYALLRALPNRAGRLAFIAQLDRSQANLALLRFRLVEAEKHLF
jgi:hypothetical protein